MTQNITDLTALLHKHIKWSYATFGPGARTDGLLEHIRSELMEIKEEPEDVTEWIDVVILAFDGAWRSGHNPEEIVTALNEKYLKNEARTWPDWKTADPNAPIFHVKDEK